MESVKFFMDIEDASFVPMTIVTKVEVEVVGAKVYCTKCKRCGAISRVSCRSMVMVDKMNIDLPNPIIKEMDVNCLRKLVRCIANFG